MFVHFVSFNIIVGTSRDTIWIYPETYYKMCLDKLAVKRETWLIAILLVYSFAQGAAMFIARIQKPAYFI